MQTIRIYARWFDGNGDLQEREYQVPAAKATQQLLLTIQNEIEPAFGSQGMVEFDWSGEWRDPA